MRKIIVIISVLIFLAGCSVDQAKLQDINSVAIVNITIEKNQEIDGNVLSFIFDPSKIVKSLNNTASLIKTMSTREKELYIIIGNIISDFFEKKFETYKHDQALLDIDDYFNSFVKEVPQQFGKEYYVVPPYKYIDLASASSGGEAKLLCEHLNVDAVISLMLSYKMSPDVINGQKVNEKYATLTAKLVMVNKLGETLINNAFITNNPPKIRLNQPLQQTYLHELLKVMQSPEENLKKAIDTSVAKEEQIRHATYLLSTGALLKDFERVFYN